MEETGGILCRAAGMPVEADESGGKLYRANGVPGEGEESGGILYRADGVLVEAEETDGIFAKENDGRDGGRFLGGGVGTEVVLMSGKGAGDDGGEEISDSRFSYKGGTSITSSLSLERKLAQKSRSITA